MGIDRPLCDVAKSFSVGDEVAVVRCCNTASASGLLGAFGVVQYVDDLCGGSETSPQGSVIGVKTSRNRETVAFRPEELEAVVVVDERVFKASPVGWYDELVDLALERVAPVERCREKSQYRVRQYVRMYQSGSPFPPIVVAGPIPGAQRHKIIDGHHRYLAARKVGAASMLAWTCFYVPFRGANGPIHYRLARMSDTEIGHKIAAKLGREWCPGCGGFLNYDRRTGECRSCGYPGEQTAATHSVQAAG